MFDAPYYAKILIPGDATEAFGNRLKEIDRGNVTVGAPHERCLMVDATCFAGGHPQ